MRTHIIRTIVVGSLLLLPTSFALAHGPEIEAPHVVDLSAETSVKMQAELNTRGGRGRDQAEDDLLAASSTASSTHKGGYWSNPDNAEDVRGREGDEMHRETRATASNTREQNDDHRRGGDRRENKVKSFLAWLLGQPDTTTIGDIRAELNASTTLGSSTPGSTRGLGFFARLFGFIHRSDN